MAIPDIPTDPRLGVVSAARERLIDLKLTVAIASGITMVALCGAVAYSTDQAVMASAQSGNPLPSDSTTQGSGAGNTTPATNGQTVPAPGSAPRRSTGSNTPSRTTPKIVTAQS
ncbi:MAG: hypothetical protein M3O87_05130 [Candidatus Dormibacteraeota bacterium]|nr:hypothetical protein [Candidatus Dormibacteraeota bacterium]